MSTITSLVPKRLHYPNPTEVVERVRQYMIQQKYIRQKTAVNTLGDGLGHLPGRKYKDILIDRDHLNQVQRMGINGVAFITERRVFTGIENGLDEITCPVCTTNLIDDDWADALSDWYEGGDGLMECPYCEEEADLNAYTFRSCDRFRWAFSNVGVSFYNWPPEFLPPFIMQLEKLFEAPVVVVRADL